jgi:hypothetical protein
MIFVPWGDEMQKVWWSRDEETLREWLDKFNGRYSSYTDGKRSVLGVEFESSEDALMFKLIHGL